MPLAERPRGGGSQGRSPHGAREILRPVSSPWTECVTCPCCRYPTLTERGAYEICCLCNWEDDGQADADADDVRGGPNRSYSLTEARENFRRYWVMYSPNRDTRIGGGDSDAAVAAKQRLAHAFDAMKDAGDAEVVRLGEVVREARAVLDHELEERVREYEAKH